MRLSKDCSLCEVTFKFVAGKHYFRRENWMNFCLAAAFSGQFFRNKLIPRVEYKNELLENMEAANDMPPNWPI